MTRYRCTTWRAVSGPATFRAKVALPFSEPSAAKIDRGTGSATRDARAATIRVAAHAAAVLAGATGSRTIAIARDYTPPCCKAAISDAFASLVLRTRKFVSARSLEAHGSRKHTRTSSLEMSRLLKPPPDLLAASIGHAQMHNCI
jgi:hypothetical protein